VDVHIQKAVQLTPLEKLAAVYGDAWAWIDFSPMYKLVPAWVVGKRTLRHAPASFSAEIGHRWAYPVLHQRCIATLAPDYLEHQLTLALAYYHFVVPHRSLRRRLPRTLPTKGRNGSCKKWQPVTPAVAA
jgi:hypothetical protein